jgi:hypothetical protein
MKALERMLVISLLSTICVSYGQDTGASPRPPDPPPAKSEDFTSPLNGTWHVTGVDSRDPGRAKSPFLSLSIEADGDQLHGQAIARGECRNAIGGYGSGGVLVGNVTADGTFELHGSPEYGSSVPQLVIHGTVPTSGDASWRGTFTLKSPPARGPCIYEESAAFTATRYPPFTGTYSGAIGGTGLGAHPTVTIQVSQGEPGHYSGGFLIPLSGQVTLAGSPCFSKGTTTSKRNNEIQGDSASLSFKMDDGSVLHLFGTPFGDPKRPKFWIHVEVEGGQCDHARQDGDLAPQ